MSDYDDENGEEWDPSEHEVYPEYDEDEMEAAYEEMEDEDADWGEEWGEDDHS